MYWNKGRCIAYPQRIPFMIISGQTDHMIPRPGQVGDTVFTPVDRQVWRETRQRVPLVEVPEPT